MRRRRGFTLVEVVLALALAGIVASLAYAALSAGIDGSRAVTRSAGAADADARFRVIVSEGLRHMAEASRAGEPAMETGASTLRFRTTSLVSGAPNGGAWTVRLAADDSGVVLRAASDDGARELQARLPGVTGFRVRAQSLGVANAWQDTWTSVSPPRVVRIDFAPAPATLAPPAIVAVAELRP